MRNFERLNAPDFLIEKWERWGERYEDRKTARPNIKFSWPTNNKQPINRELEPLLASQTQRHCSYCDCYPLGSREDSIDHFKPKSNPAYYKLVCNWHNLYYSCPNCQAYKLEQFNQFLLRPDAADYSFERYFVYSYNTHKIDPRPGLSTRDLRKAKETIRIFGLNDTKHVAGRRISLERFIARKNSGDAIELDDYSYRFILE